MLKFIVKWILFKTILKRFWWVPLAFAALQRFLPWERDRASKR